MSTEEKASTTDLDAVATVLRRIEAKLIAF